MDARHCSYLPFTGALAAIVLALGGAGRTQSLAQTASPTGDEPQATPTAPLRTPMTVTAGVSVPAQPAAEVLLEPGAGAALVPRPVQHQQPDYEPLGRDRVPRLSVRNEEVGRSRDSEAAVHHSIR